MAAASSSSSSTHPPSIDRTKGPTGLEKLVLREARGWSAEVQLYGGQVTSWKNDHGDELLFVSSKALFKPSKAIRVGIPICFPQFGTQGNPEIHGFTRSRFWAIDDNPPPLPIQGTRRIRRARLLLRRPARR